MTTCPNCGQSVTKDDDICPNCGFNLKKYRDTFFEDDSEKKSVSSQPKRAQYREEFRPKKQNTTIQKMIAWVRSNATIVFLLGVVLLVIMSFSRALGWTSFLVLMVWLFIVCDKADKIEQYTADKRLTEMINKMGSDVVNTAKEHTDKVRKKGKDFTETHPHVNRHVEKVKERSKSKFSYIQLSVVLTSVISLIVLFTGSGAAVADVSYTQKLSLSKVILNLANRLLSSSHTSMSAIILYVFWLLLVLFPIFIIYNIFKNTKNSQFFAFILSLLETAFLIYIVFKISNNSSNHGMIGELTNQFLMYAVSIGSSAYFLILASLLTTGLAGYNYFKKRSLN